MSLLQDVAMRYTHASGSQREIKMKHNPAPFTQPPPHQTVVAKQQRRYEKSSIYYIGQRQRGGSASFRRADAAQVCNHVGFVAVDGEFECSSAKSVMQIVSERW